jgi:hypothetical protein
MAIFRTYQSEALIGFFLRRVSQEQGSVEKLSSEIDSMEPGATPDGSCRFEGTQESSRPQ